MFLNLLNDGEKRIFLKLAVAVIQADGRLEESEKQYIADYSREMGITEYSLDEKIEVKALAEKIGKDSTDTVKRIFLLELTACANADGDFADTEKSLINTLVKTFKLSNSSIQECLDLLNKYAMISTKLAKFIQGEK